MMKNVKHPNIGAHVGAAGGLWNAVENAKAIGASCFQIFGASPRQWRANMPRETEVKKFKGALKESNLGHIYLHAAYLVNIASGSKELLKKSIENLTAHLKIAEMLGAEGLIFHPGSWKGMRSKKEGLVQEVKAIQEILKNVPGKAKLILENTAGGGEKIGTLEDIEYLYAKVKSKRVSVCVDTAHAFESGMIQKYAPKEIKVFLDAWDTSVGLENIPVLHVNDSKTAEGSHHDRHENIGEGYNGKEGFKALAKEGRLWDKDWILEVPGCTNEGPDKKNIDILKSCFHV